jgi:hypothetical protein
LRRKAALDRMASAQLFSRPSASERDWSPFGSSSMAFRARSSRCLSAIRPAISCPFFPQAKACDGNIAA